MRKEIGIAIAVVVVIASLQTINRIAGPLFFIAFLEVWALMMWLMIRHEQKLGRGDGVFFFWFVGLPAITAIMMTVLKIGYEK